MKTVFVLIVVHNGVEFTLDCLADLETQEYRPLEIRLFDCGSTDGTVEAVRRRFPSIRVDRVEEPVWWGEGMRLGTEKVLEEAAEGDFFLSMNNDVRIRDTRYVSTLVEESERYQNALVSAHCWYRDDLRDVESSGGVFRWQKGLFMHNIWMPEQETLEGLDFLTGRGTLIPIRALKRTGNYDSARFPHVLTDFDIAQRAKLAGYPLLITRKTGLSHLQRPVLTHGSSTFLSYRSAWQILFSRRSYYCLRDNFTFIDRYGPRGFKTLAKTVNLGKALLLSFGQTFPFKLICGPLAGGILRVFHGRRERA